MKVLYVEDNPANVFLVKRVARMGNHEIINYIDGGQALKKYDEISPDLVLMDIQLAGDKTGLDVVRELRARGIKTTIIAVTAYAMVGDKERCIEAGCDDYLAKPLPIPRLVEIFEMHSKRVAEASKNAPTATVTETPKTESVPVTEAPKIEAAPLAETPKVEAPKAEPVAEALKIETAPLADAPKVEAVPVTELPKAEVAPAAEALKIEAAPLAETPKVEAPKAEPVAEALKIEAAPLAETPIVDKVRTSTAPLPGPDAEAKPADATTVSEVKAVEEAKPAETPDAKTSEEGKKEAEQSSVKPETSSN